MSKKLALATIAAAFALCFALVGCSGGQASSDTDSGSSSSGTASNTSGSSATEGGGSSSSSQSDATAASDNHDSYFVGRWELYESADATHEQIVQVMEQYANDPDVRAQMNEAYGRDNIDFHAQFNADGTGTIDTGLEVAPFTWEATNSGAVTFTSFNGKDTALHLPVTDDKFTLDNGDTYAKAQ